MNIQIWQLDATNGEAAILCIPEEKFAAFCSPVLYYWLQEFHFDGLRMDAVGNLIYWQGDSKPRGESGSSEVFADHESGAEGTVTGCYAVCRGFHTLPGSDEGCLGRRTWI